MQSINKNYYYYYQWPPFLLWLLLLNQLNVGISPGSVLGSLFFSSCTLHSHGFNYHSHTNNSLKSVSLIQSLPLSPRHIYSTTSSTAFTRKSQRHLNSTWPTLNSSSFQTSHFSFFHYLNKFIPIHQVVQIINLGITMVSSFILNPHSQSITISCLLYSRFSSNTHFETANLFQYNWCFREQFSIMQILHLFTCKFVHKQY